MRPNDFPMIKKGQAEEIIRKDQIAASRRSSKKMNDWVSKIMREAVPTAMETPASMEGPPSMDTPPWKGTHGDA